MQTNTGTRQLALLAIAVVLFLLAGFFWLHHRAAGSVPAPGSGRASPVVPIQFVGIGVALRTDPRTDELVIENVIPDTPAARAGLTKGEVISRIDDTPTAGLKLKQCIDELRGAEGTVVRVEVISPDGSATNTMEITRRKIQR